jgi:hypothetical protein
METTSTPIRPQKGRDAGMQHLTVSATAGGRRFTIGVLITAATIISCGAHPRPARAQDPQPSLAPGYGRVWYEKYCTPCHGVGGGPGDATFVASNQPIDLRTYVHRHGDKFPAGDWLMVVINRPPQNPHTKVWEDLRRHEAGGIAEEAATRGKVKSIADYIMSIQDVPTRW